MSQNGKDLQTQVARIRQTLEKVLYQNISLAERICTLFREQGITIFSILTALSMIVSTIVLVITGVFGGGSRGAGGSTPKDEGILKKWLDRLADAFKRLAGKAVEALPDIVGSVVSAILSFLGKTVGFVAKHTWALIAFVAGLVGLWLMQKVKKGYVFASSCHINGVGIGLFMISLKGHKRFLFFFFLFIIRDGRYSHGI